MSLSQLLAGYARFKDRIPTEPESCLPAAGDPQPGALWVGCSDSRVIPELITGARPGDLLVLRNIANILPPFGVACDTIGAVIEYAVLRMRVADVVVCGHTECAGIKCLGEPLDYGREPHIARWVELARPAYTRVEAANLPQGERYLETIRANVLLQCDNLRSYPCVQDALRAGELQVHGWLYDVRSGALQAYDAATGQWYPL